MSDKQSENQKLDVIRHSVSHIMAQAVVKLFPGTKTAIGPSIENGFYYDFLLPTPITVEDLRAIETEMKKIIDSRQDFVKVTTSRKEALERFTGEDFKIELINELPENEDISIDEHQS
jgi:threonyl-tRNA synthetase